MNARTIFRSIGILAASLAWAAAAAVLAAEPPTAAVPPVETDWPLWKAYVHYREESRTEQKQFEASYVIYASGAPKQATVRFLYSVRREDGTKWSAANTIVFESFEQLWRVPGPDAPPGITEGVRLRDGGVLTGLGLPVIWLITEGGRRLVNGADDIKLELIAEYPDNRSVIIEGGIGEQAEVERDEKLDQLEREGMAMAEKMLKSLGRDLPPDVDRPPPAGRRGGGRPGTTKPGSVEDMARQAQQLFERGMQKALPPLPKDEKVEGSRQWTDGHAERVRHSMSWSFQLLPQELEAVLIPVGKDEGSEVAYESWLPKAADHENDPGNILAVRVVLKPRQGPPVSAQQTAHFRFELLTKDPKTNSERKGSSREKGICLNEPAKAKAKDAHDLRILKTDNEEFETIAPDGQSAETRKGLHEAEIVIRAYDYGAYGELRVTALLDDGRHRPIRARWDKKKEPSDLTIPLDENGNRIADAWERKHEIYELGLPADWERAQRPEGQGADGDGISLYEKYRGFMFAKGHERLDPNQKYIFVYDPDYLVGLAADLELTRSRSFFKVSGIRVRYVTDERWTGPGSSSQGRRVVNFNHGWGHAVDQHALHVVETKKESWPLAWEKIAKPYKLRSVFRERDFLGYAFPDGPMSAATKSPKDLYEIRIYYGEIERYILNAAILSVCSSHGGCQTEHDTLAAMNDLARYDEKNPTHFRERFLIVQAVTVSHEMGHGVGLEHHVPDTSYGDEKCVMRYENPEVDCRLNAGDPYLLQCYKGLPDRISKDPVHGCKGVPSCWQGIVVTDRKRP